MTRYKNIVLVLDPMLYRQNNHDVHVSAIDIVIERCNSAGNSYALECIYSTVKTADIIAVVCKPYNRTNHHGLLVYPEVFLLVVKQMNWLHNCIKQSQDPLRA